MASGPPFPGPVSCENLYGILISNYYCSHWQAAIFLCVFVCVAVISKNNDNVNRRGSTLVSTVLRKSVRFFIINIFLIIKNTFQVETWAICCLSDSKTQERGLKELNTKTFLGEPAPQSPLDNTCAFGPHLGNRSVFIPAPHLVKMQKNSHDNDKIMIHVHCNIWILLRR